jgi:hypothetical protein
MLKIGKLGIISGVIAAVLTVIGLTFASAGPKPPETGADNNSGLSTSRLGF